MKTKILYLSYNGMMEHLGASQVLSYIYKLSANYQFYLVSLEKPNDLKNLASFEELKISLRKKNIIWIPLEYKTNQTGKLFNLFRFTLTANRLIRKEKIKFIHCRSYMTAFSAYFIQQFHEVKYLFDTRSFSFDERADVGSLNRNNILYKLAKRFERSLYKKASGIIILSKIGKETILNNQLFKGGDKINNIEIITTCVDLKRFKLHDRDYTKKTYTIGYVGTATGWYDFEKTAATLAQIKKFVNFKFLVFNDNQYGQHDLIANSLAAHGIQENEYQLEKVSFSKMPERLKEIDIALFYIHPYFSKKASAATKLGELLASGIPVLTNKDVGDHEYFITEYKVGKILDFESLETYDFKLIFEELINIETAQRCRLLSEKYFSLEKGVEKYAFVYTKIFN